MNYIPSGCKESDMIERLERAHTRTLFAETFWDPASSGPVAQLSPQDFSWLLLSGFQFLFLDLLLSFVYTLRLLEHIFQSFLWVKNVS